MNKALNLVNKEMPKATLVNAVVSILLSILIIAFSFIRTALTTQAFGVASLGFIAIILGILPYLSTSHSGLISVATSNLYHDMHAKNWPEVNRKIGQLKPQFYLFGSVYLLITFVLAFCFPFVISSNGEIIINEQPIAWYESTLFVLSNTVESFATFFIVPISVILLFITKKSYISNSISIIITVVLNVLLIIIYVLIIQKQIDLSFIEMNIIVFAVLGCKMLILLGFLYAYRKKHFSWYQRTKIKHWAIKKDSLQAIGNQYFSQFGTDLVSILFIIYAAVVVTAPTSTASLGVSLYHGGDGQVGDSDFIPSAIYSVYLLIIVNIKELIHSIADAAIPSVAEHVSFNEFKLNPHMYHRYQILTVYIALFTTSSYILVSGISQGLFLHDELNVNEGINQINLYLIALLWIPNLIEIFSDMYGHLLPIFGNFKDLLKTSFIKAVINLLMLSFMAPLVFVFADPDFLMNGIFLVIIISTTVANLTSYFILRKKVHIHITCDHCINITKSTWWCLAWILVCLALMLPMYIYWQNDFGHLIDLLSPVYLVLIAIGGIVVNSVLCVFWISLFRKVDVKYYSEQFKSSMKKLHSRIN